jgi:Siphovirus Gp157
MSDLAIKSEFTRFTELRRRLIEADPQIDETTLLDTLEGATSLHEAIGEVVRVALEEEAMADGLKVRMIQMRERLERIETACARKREVALAVMEEAGIEKILEPDFTVSLRVAPPGVVITSEEDIPEWFWVPQPAKLDRRRILDTLKAGTAVMGAALSNSRVCLSVRTK